MVDTSFGARLGPHAEIAARGSGNRLYGGHWPIPATAFIATVGAPSQLGFGDIKTPIWSLDKDVAEYVTASIYVPAGWKTFNVYLIWVNVGAGAGDVRWSFYKAMYAVGTNLNTAVANTSTANVTAAAQYLTKETSIATVVTATAGSLFVMQIGREGANAGDTLGNDAGLIGLELRRVT